MATTSHRSLRERVLEIFRARRQTKFKDEFTNDLQQEPRVPTIGCCSAGPEEDLTCTTASTPQESTSLACGQNDLLKAQDLLPDTTNLQNLHSRSPFHQTIPNPSTCPMEKPSGTLLDESELNKHGQNASTKAKKTGARCKGRRSSKVISIPSLKSYAECDDDTSVPEEHLSESAHVFDQSVEMQCQGQGGGTTSLEKQNKHATVPEKLKEQTNKGLSMEQFVVNTITAPTKYSRDDKDGIKVNKHNENMKSVPSRLNVELDNLDRIQIRNSGNVLHIKGCFKEVVILAKEEVGPRKCVTDVGTSMGEINKAFNQNNLGLRETVIAVGESVCGSVKAKTVLMKSCLAEDNKSGFRADDGMESLLQRMLESELGDKQRRDYIMAQEALGQKGNSTNIEQTLNLSSNLEENGLLSNLASSVECACYVGNEEVECLIQPNNTVTCKVDVVVGSLIPPKDTVMFQIENCAIKLLNQPNDAVIFRDIGVTANDVKQSHLAGEYNKDAGRCLIRPEAASEVVDSRIYSFSAISCGVDEVVKCLKDANNAVIYRDGSDNCEQMKHEVIHRNGYEDAEQMNQSQGEVIHIDNCKDAEQINQSQSEDIQMDNFEHVEQINQSKGEVIHVDNCEDVEQINQSICEVIHVDNFEDIEQMNQSKGEVIHVDTFENAEQMNLSQDDEGIESIDRFITDSSYIPFGVPDAVTSRVYCCFGADDGNYENEIPEETLERLISQSDEGGVCWIGQRIFESEEDRAATKSEGRNQSVELDGRIARMDAGRRGECTCSYNPESFCRHASEGLGSNHGLDQGQESGSGRSGHDSSQEWDLPSNCEATKTVAVGVLEDDVDAKEESESLVGIGGLEEVCQLKRRVNHETRKLNTLFSKHKSRVVKVDRLQNYLDQLKREKEEITRLFQGVDSETTSLRQETADLRCTVTAVCDTSVANIGKETNARRLEPACYRRYNNIRTSADASNALASVRNRVKALNDLEVLIYRKQLILNHSLPSTHQEKIPLVKGINASKSKNSEPSSCSPASRNIEMTSEPSSWSEVIAPADSPVTVSTPLTNSIDGTPIAAPVCSADV